MRRAKSGAIASDIYNNKIVNERSYMQATNTRIVTFEMCGNDYLQARSQFAGQSGTCNYTGGNNALANCTNYTGLAMNAINQYATTATREDRVEPVLPGLRTPTTRNSNCTDSVTGQPVNKQSNILPLLAKSNWRTCNLAEQRGFACADSFAQYMGADYDSNGDGLIDSEALRYVSGESEAAYVTQDHGHAALDDPRREHALREREHELRLHPVGQHASDVLRRDPELGRLGLGRRRSSAARRSWAGRTRSGTASVTSGWAGRCRSSTRRRRSGAQSRKRASTSAGTPA